VPQRFSSRTSSVSRLTAIPVFVKEIPSLARIPASAPPYPANPCHLSGLSLHPRPYPACCTAYLGYPCNLRSYPACCATPGVILKSLHVVVPLATCPIPLHGVGPLVTWMSPTTPSPTALHATIAFAFCASNQLLSSCHHLTSHTCRDASRRLTELDARLHTSASYSMTLASSCQLKSTAIRVFSSRLFLHLSPDANTC
jgi:hypothetical protein